MPIRDVRPEPAPPDPGRVHARLPLLVPVSNAKIPIAAVAPRTGPLWLCVHLTGLPVDVFDGPPGAPLAATATVKGRVVIAACNGIARRRGVQDGMTLTAALSLCEDLKNLPRDPSAECGKLNKFAHAACRLSGTVGLFTEDSVVLEIGGSLQLFGGLPGVLRRAREEFSGLRARFVFGIAATARAADWLARHQPGRYVLFAEDLPAVLRALPVAVLAPGEKMLRQLEQSGIRTLGALLRLPRMGAARRFGPELVEALDRALGRAPEALSLFSPPRPFEAEEEFYPPVADWPRLVPHAEHLLRGLEHDLRRRQAATQRVDCLLRHEHVPATLISLGTARHERRAAVLLDLLARHFERTPLPAAITGLAVRCEDMQVLPPESLHLIESGAGEDRHWPQLLDRLMARMGKERLSKPVARDDHRPEHAGAGEDPRALSAAGAVWNDMPRRPVWLLRKPARLGEADGRPEWNGRLTLSRLPERIEQGWWDGGDVRRDYYLARNPVGAQLWVYRDRTDRGWYLHGIFA